MLLVMNKGSIIYTIIMLSLKAKPTKDSCGCPPSLSERNTFIPCVRYSAQEANAICTSNGVASTQRDHRRHSLSKSFLDLFHHPATRELFNSVDS